jgi:hypothetical protein
MPTALTVKAAAVPQITAIKAPLNTPSVAQSTPRPTSKDTTTKTLADKNTVPAILAILLHLLEFIIRCEFGTPPFQRTLEWFPQRRPLLQPRKVPL